MGGDWNNHIGQSSLGDQPRDKPPGLGRHLLSRLAAQKAKQVLDFMREAEYRHADSYVSMQERYGRHTWFSPMDDSWCELDYVLTNDRKQHIRRMRSFDYSISQNNYNTK